MRKDWIGLWFTVQAERGHSDAVPFFLARLAEKKFDDFGFRHRDMDGMAAMAGALRALGLEPKRAPRAVPRPSVFSVPRLLWRGLAGNNGGGRPNWRSLRTEILAKPKSFAFLVLREEAEAALKKFLAEKRISLTAYLLSRLSRAMEPELLDGPVSGSWLLPVDMRPAFPGRPLSGNCVSYVKVPAAGEAEDIHREIKRALGAFEHWSNWWVYHIGKVVGLKGMRKLSLRSSQRTFWLGSFTDLGDWTLVTSASLSLRDSVWAIAAPGTPNSPVGCATVAWFGQRSISLRVHPSIGDSEAAAGAILHRLAKMIAEETGGPEAGLLETPVRE